MIEQTTARNDSPSDDSPELPELVPAPTPAEHADLDTRPRRNQTNVNYNAQMLRLQVQRQQQPDGTIHNHLAKMVMNCPIRLLFRPVATSEQNQTEQTDPIYEIYTKQKRNLIKTSPGQ